MLILRMENPQEFGAWSQSSRMFQLPEFPASSYSHLVQGFQLQGLDEASGSPASLTYSTGDSRQQMQHLQQLFKIYNTL